MRSKTTVDLARTADSHKRGTTNTRECADMVSSTDSDPENVDLLTIQRESVKFFAGTSNAIKKVAGGFIIV